MPLSRGLVEVVARKPRLVFFGTPDFAVPALQALIRSNEFDIVACVTQPDKPAGRGKQLTSPPIKIAAETAGIPVLQPSRVRPLELTDGRLSSTSAQPSELAEFLNRHAPIDCGIVIAYGKILPETLIQFFPAGMINIHASLLPRWRGAAPIHHALLEGDRETGVCLMQLVPELDAGPVFVVEQTAITSEDTFGSLHDRLAALGADLLARHLSAILEGRVSTVVQSATGVTYAAKWEKTDVQINWAEPASRIDGRVRASSPHPGCVTTLDGESIKVYKVRVVVDPSLPAALPGTVVESNRGEVIVATGSGDYISLEELQFAGRRRLPIAEILKSRRFEVGTVFTALPSL